MATTSSSTSNSPESLNNLNNNSTTAGLNSTNNVGNTTRLVGASGGGAGGGLFGEGFAGYGSGVPFSFANPTGVPFPSDERSERSDERREKERRVGGGGGGGGGSGSDGATSDHPHASSFHPRRSVPSPLHGQSSSTTETTSTLNLSAFPKLTGTTLPSSPYSPYHTPLHIIFTSYNPLHIITSLPPLIKHLSSHHHLPPSPFTSSLGTPPSMFLPGSMGALGSIGGGGYTGLSRDIYHVIAQSSSSSSR